MEVYYGHTMHFKHGKIIFNKYGGVTQFFVCITYFYIFRSKCEWYFPMQKTEHRSYCELFICAQRSVTFKLECHNWTSWGKKIITHNRNVSVKVNAQIIMTDFKQVSRTLICHWPDIQIAPPPNAYHWLSQCGYIKMSTKNDTEGRKDHKSKASRASA